MPNQQSVISGPFMGVVSDLTSPQGPPNDFDDISNFFVRKGALHTRPKLNLFSNDVANVQRVSQIGSFQDANFNWHTYKLLDTHNSPTVFSAAAFLRPGGPPYNWDSLTMPSLPAGSLDIGLRYSRVTVGNIVIFCNGGYPVMYLDGSNTVQTLGDVPGTARYVTENANHVIIAYTQEPALGSPGATLFPRRVRWSGVNNPFEWATLTDFTAGSNDLLDVPDGITGLNTLGRNTYIWRSNGVTVMSPTGQGLTPWFFENFSISEDGIGSIFPYCLATYGNQCMFVARDNVYIFDGTSFTSVTGISQTAASGANRRRIYNDLALSTTNPPPWATIIPNWTLGFDMLCYVLSIQRVDGVNITWVYTMEDGQWMRFSSAQGMPTAINSLVSIS
jgi:hypothetical protein